MKTATSLLIFLLLTCLAWTTAFADADDYGDSDGLIPKTRTYKVSVTNGPYQVLAPRIAYLKPNRYYSPKKELENITRRILGKVPRYEAFHKIPNTFYGFPWLMIKIDRVHDMVGLCAAEMTFTAEEESDIPRQRIKALKDKFVADERLEIVRVVETDDKYSVLARSDGIKYRFYALKTSFDTGIHRYTIGFSFERILEDCEYNPLKDYEYKNWRWQDVVHVTSVNDPQNEKSWRYRIPHGESSEALLRKYIETGNKSLIAVNEVSYGHCIGFGSGKDATNYTAGTEEEAEIFYPGSKCYAYEVDETTMLRRYEMLTKPECFRAGRTKPVYANIGSIFWDVIPGDTIAWYDAKKRYREGVVVRDDEEGEYWEPIKAKVKVTTDEILATDDDWKPTALTREYEEKRKELFAKMKKEELGTFLANCRAEMKEGYFRNPNNTCSVIDMQRQTKELVRKKVLARERSMLDSWQYELHAQRIKALELYFGAKRPSRYAAPDAATMKRLGLSREEVLRFTNPSQWHSVHTNAWALRSLGYLNTGFREADERRELPSAAALQECLAELTALAASEDTEMPPWWTDNSLITIGRAFEIYLDNPGRPDAERIKQAAMRVIASHPSYQVSIICQKLCMEYPESESVAFLLEDILNYITDPRYAEAVKGLLKALNET